VHFGEGGKSSAVVQSAEADEGGEEPNCIRLERRRES